MRLIFDVIAADVIRAILLWTAAAIATDAAMRRCIGSAPVSKAVFYRPQTILSLTIRRICRNNTRQMIRKAEPRILHGSIVQRRSPAVAEGTRDARCYLKSCRMLQK